ncbi:MAG: AAA domain-containing protein, partial [Bacteroidota bacterium]
VMHASQVVTCTLVGASSHYLDRLKFDTLIIDEAAQALEPACWIAIPRAPKLVLAGDPHQLPPTIKSKEARQGGLATTLIEKAIKILPEVDLLDTQYRMHQTIMGFSNQLFYANQLQAHASVADRQLILESGPQPPLDFIDTAGCGFTEQQNPETLSYKNPDELILLREHLDLLLADVPEGEVPTIGIISPYKEQVRYMRAQFEQDQDFQYHYAVTINTIDSFQGQERDVIYISLVRSNSNNVIGFLADTRRMNVAMTRAKKKLIIIGDSGTIGTHAFYAQFLDYCEQQDAYRSAWEYMS